MIAALVSLHPAPSHLKAFKFSDLSPSLSGSSRAFEKGTNTALQEALILLDAVSTVTRDIEGVNCIPALLQTTMEKLVGNVSCEHEHRGNSNSHASDAEENETDELQKRKVVKPDGLSIFLQTLEEVDESTHTLSTRVATFCEACRSAVLGPFHVVSKYGGKGSCSESVMTFLWYGFLWRCLSTGSSSASAQRYDLGAASSHLQRVSFALPPFRGWCCAEGSSCKHHALEQRATPNSPDEVYRCMFCSRLVLT